VATTSEIQEMFFRRILDSRGNETIEVDILTDEGFGRAAAPSGASTGAHEVQAWPEGGPKAGVEKAYDIIAPTLRGMDALDQRAVDDTLAEIDGTENFAALGGNVTVATSLAVARAAAHSLGLPLYAYLGGAFVSRLPRPLGNVLGGGAHAIGGTDIQEFMVFADGPTFQDSAFANAKVHKRVKDLLKKELPNTAIGKGDEGAWVAPIKNERALAIVADAAKHVASEVGFEVRPALDVAATELWDAKRKAYVYKDAVRTTDEQVAFLEGLVKDYGVVSVEDGLAEDDWEGWQKLTKAIGSRATLVGDDLFVTNPTRLERGIREKAANAILVKPNQIGTLTRTVQAIQMAHGAGFRSIISHRSGETSDESIAHIGAAFGCWGIKTGAVGGERTAKLNELIRIEEEV